MLIVLALVAFLFWPGAACALPVAPAQSLTVNIESISGVAPQTKEELSRFYALRDFHPVWDLSDEETLKKAGGFIDSLDQLATWHGLDKEVYRLDDMRGLLASTAQPDKQKLEFMITASLLHLAHDLHGDDLNLDALYPGWDFHRKAADIPALLNAAITSGTMNDFFQQIAPQQTAYRALAAALQRYSEIEAKSGWPTVASGATLLPQDRGVRVAQLRARLAAEGYVAVPAEGQGDFFDDALEEALIDYQNHNGLLPDGHAGAETLAAVNVPVAQRILQIRANMERWRHMTEEFPPDRYVMVNIPDFTVTIRENGVEVYTGRVVDGRTDRPTPFVDSRILNMVINPAWHVPLSIARKDILPKLRKNPYYLEKLGAVIVGRDDDPAGTTIDWKDVSPKGFTYRLRQDPGDMNSLGQLKFNFYSPFGVYMHGTPHQELFGKATRDFSSGCVRLAEPTRVGEILLEDNKENGGWDQQRISDAIDAGNTRTVTLASPISVYFLYWSVFFDSDGKINFRKDIYGYDSSLMNKVKN
ncbi:MAG: L,D-transpeptidase family protein [Alphaproteobacteria bacterium]|nr:L,D-transpeptidase family protein [Alphaproteobacteria bacterium]